ncbi:MAG: dTDP-4-dehydrorhamnose 3,5-epimerase family protein [Candidatus Hodarchaeota archaeon]
MIDGVKITPLRQILDERGKIMHMLRCDDPHFLVFGEIYFSFVHQGAIKGWHRHKSMTINYAVPYGKIKLVLYDDRPQSSTKDEIVQLFLGPDNYQLVTIPPMVWNGFKGIARNNMVANCATAAHDPDEIERLDPFSEKIPYDWSIKHG